MRQRNWSQRGLYALAICAPLMGGCTGGDFGRTRETFLTDNMHKWVGEEAVGSIGEQPSRFRLTDDERTLRDQAYYFIEPPRSRPFYKSVFGDYQRIPAPWGQKGVGFDRTAYGRLLLTEQRRSQVSAYAELIEDIRNDLTQLDPFFVTAGRVADIDAKRGKGLAYISQMRPEEREDAQARMRENAMIVQWVQQCLQRRVASYRWALERLVLNTPDPAAAEAERVLLQLAQRADSAMLARMPVGGRAISVGG